MALQHLRSSTANKRPLPAGMSDGQLAINTNLASPGLFFKDSNGDLVKVGPVHVGTTAPNASPASGGQTGNTLGEQWLDTTGGTYVFKVWDGSAWRSESGTFVDVNGDVMTGALGIIAGTAGSPGLYISGDTNTGIYSPGADQVSVATGGTERLRIDSNGQVEAVSLGTDAAPVFSFTGDPNTGIYSPGADQLALSTNGTGRLFVSSAGNVSIGASGAGQRLRVNVGTDQNFAVTSTNSVAQLQGINDAGNAFVPIDIAGSNIRISPNSSEIARFTSTGLGIGTSSVDSLLHIESSNTPTITLEETGYKAEFRAAGNDLEIRCDEGGTGGKLEFYVGGGTTGTGQKMTIDAAGRVGIGTTSPGAKLHVAAGGSTVALQLDADTGSNTSIALSKNGSIKWYFGNDQSNDGFRFYDNTAASERARIDSSGRLLVGTSSAPSGYTANLMVAGNGGDATTTSPVLGLGNNWTNSPSAGGSLGGIRFGTANYAGALISAQGDAGWTAGSSHPSRLVFSTTADGASSPTERMRIDNAGKVFIGKTSRNFDATGVEIVPTGGSHWVANATTCLSFNRLTNDGDLIEFGQGGFIEGTISVSGSTVSYNGAHLSRWSQLPGGVERTEILRGTVLSNIDEMCEWGEEDNEQLNRMKVSDVEGDKNVSGVFQAWDDDDDTYTNDFYCAMTGDFIIRIGAGVTVERGDLLMSAGDGTAKPQDDDIIRSKTIAKVTSTTVSCTYDDGSYCVPCVLMAC